MLVIVCGLPLTGKSTVSRQIAEDIKGKILRTDVIRKELFKEATLKDVMKSDDPMLFDLEKVFDVQVTIPDKYQKMIWKQKKMVYDELFHRINALLRERETVILDGTFYQKNLRKRIYSITRENSTNVFLIECYCSEDFIKERLTRRKKTPDDASNVDRLHVYLKLKESYERPVSDNEADSLPLIFYDTGLQKVEMYNIKQGNEELKIVINSIKKLIKKFS